MPRDRVEYENQSSRVILLGSYFKCTYCNCLRPGSEFGLRKMQDGSIRNQAQCSSCRGRSGGTPF